MRSPRSISQEEKGVLSALLQLKPEIAHYIAALDDLLVREMSDGGMGSLLLIPNGTDDSNRSFGKQIVAGEFTDSDDVLVSVVINTDSDDKLYEMDVWKVNLPPC